MEFLFTTNDKYFNYAVKELKNEFPDFCISKKINKNQAIGFCSKNISEISEKIIKKPIIFVRHVFKIDKKYILNNQKITQDIFEDIIYNCLKILNKNKSFSFQIVEKNNNYKIIKDISLEFSNKLIENNFVLNVKNPEQIITLYFDDNNLYFGVGSKNLNLSAYKNGEPHFSTKNDFISRAEFKLLEAFDVFDINVNGLKVGADLGAAPGGWTKVLSQNGVFVHAIDPAELNKSVLALNNVIHHKQTTQKFLKNNNTKFDIVVNDMKMDMMESIEITKSFYFNINQNGIVVITFKLPDNFSISKIHAGLKSLSEKFCVVGARHLFHNRTEITVYAIKK